MRVAIWLNETRGVSALFLYLLLNNFLLLLALSAMLGKFLE